MPNNETLGASFSIDVTALKAGLTQANRLIRESESEFKAAAAGMDDWSKSQEGLEARIKHLNNAQELQQKKVAALQSEYDRLIADGLDPTSAAAVKLRTDINKEQEALAKTEKELKKQTEALEELKDSSDDTRTASDKLRDEISKQGSDLEKLKREYQDVVLEQGSSSDAAKELKSKIQNLNDELKENKKKLSDSEISLEDTGEAAEDAGECFTIAKGAIANFIADGISSLVSACGNAISSLVDLSDETQEYREDISKLKTAFEVAGHTTEAATAVYKELYSVFGEEDRAVEAAQQIAKLAKNEEEMTRMTEIATGAWAMWGDSLATESLMEAANSTAKIGTVQGTLADALEWCGVNLDDFNGKLAECTTEEERSSLIMDTLNELYDDAAEKYRENNESIIEAREATSDYNDAMAELGEEIEPTKTEITKMKTELLKELSPTLKKNVIPMFDKFSDKASDVAKKVLPPLSNALNFVVDNLDTLVGVTLGAVAAFKAFKAIMAVTTAINAAKTAVAGLSMGVGVATKAQTIWNAAMTANPIGAVITAVALLAVGIVALATALDDATEYQDTMTESQRDTVNASKDAAEAYREQKEAADELVAAELANVDYTNRLWKELQNIVDENGKVKEGYESRAEFIVGELNEALGTEYEMNGNMIQQYQEMKGSIEDVINAKRAEILLSGYEETYVTAIQNVAKAEQARAIAAQNLVSREKEYTAAVAEEQAIRAELEEQGLSGNAILMDRRYQLAQANTEKEKGLLEDARAEYDETKEAVYGYYNDITNYQNASTLLMEGKTTEAINLLNNLGTGFQTVASTAKLSADEQKKVLEQQVIDTEINARLMKQAYEDGVEGVTEEMVKTAEEQADAAKEEFFSVGGEITKGIADGAGSEEWTLTSAMNGIIDAAVNAARSRAMIKSPSRLFRDEVGDYIGLGVAEGITDSTSNVVTSAKKQIENLRKAYNIGDISAKVSAGISGDNGTAAGGKAKGAGGIVVNQINHYSQAHSRYELYKSKQETAAAVRLAMGRV